MITVNEYARPGIGYQAIFWKLASKIFSNVKLISPSNRSVLILVPILRSVSEYPGRN